AAAVRRRSGMAEALDQGLVGLARLVDLRTVRTLTGAAPVRLVVRRGLGGSACNVRRSGSLYKVKEEKPSRRFSMRQKLRIFTAGIAALLLAATAATASRDDRKTEITVHDRVEVPGHIL